MAVTERAIALALIRNRWNRGFAIPNYTPAHWWECDVFHLTAAGFFNEYEIKISRSDFKADAKKARERWVKSEDPLDLGWRKSDPIRKHSEIGKINGPCRFWYVTPPGVVRDDIPEWAGLIEIHGHQEQEILKPRKLHHSPADPKVIEHARGVCYFRLIRMMLDRWWASVDPAEFQYGEGI